MADILSFVIRNHLEIGFTLLQDTKYKCLSSTLDIVNSRMHATADCAFRLFYCKVGCAL